MFQRLRTTAIVAVASMASVVAADTIDLDYTGIVGGNSASRARVGSSTFLAGHMSHTITSGADAGTSFNTFCIELEEYANGNSSTYEIIDLADAPNPGTPYGQTKADAISAIVANAVAKGWIDGKLQATASSTMARMGAIQAAIWEALGHDFQVNSSSTSSSLRNEYSLLMAESTFDSSMRLSGLRAAVATGEQDMLIVVPLPMSVLASTGMLGLCFGVRTIRRRG
jgi:Thioester domain